MWFKYQSSRQRHPRNLFAFLITRRERERERQRVRERERGKGVPAGSAFDSSCHLLMRLGSDAKMFNV